MDEHVINNKRGRQLGSTDDDKRNKENEKNNDEEKIGKINITMMGENSGKVEYCLQK